MSVYLDTSVVVSLFVRDVFSVRAIAFAQRGASPLFLSDFAAAEFVSAIGRLKRAGELDLHLAQIAISHFDQWKGQNAVAAVTQTTDIAGADAMLRRLDLVLRAPDAINLAIAQRLGAELATFDLRMADCARALGIALVGL